MPTETQNQNSSQTQDYVASSPNAESNKGGQSSAASSSTSQPISSRNLKNWFDEFRARVSKKSQSINQSTGIEILASSQASNQSTDEISSTKDSQTQQQGNPKAISKTAGLRSRKKPGKPLAASESGDHTEQLEQLQQATSNIITATITATIEHNDASSRTDCRSGVTDKRRNSGGASPVVTALFTPLKWIIYYLLPFNYNLPWKLICLVLASFVIIAIGLASGSTDASRVFNFTNGFVCGIAAAGASFIILTLSFIVHILPKTADKEHALAGFEQRYKPSEYIEGDSILTSPLRHHARQFKLSTQDNSPLDVTYLQQGEDFSLLEVLENDDQEDDDGSINDVEQDDDNYYDNDDIGLEADPKLKRKQHSAKLSSVKLRKRLADDNYKGWMIQFIGDYELRNSSDIKLKSIFVRIEDRVLYLCKTKNSNDHHADPATPLVFISQRVYDLNSVRKFSANLLLPKNVRNKQKYIWSKKYPIKLEFQIVDEIGGIESAAISDTNKTISDNVRQIQLTLFARSCREKEEWFRKFKRIVESNRLGLGQSAKRGSLKSEEAAELLVSESLGESLLSSFKRFRCRSPSPKRDFVQTSQSSHLLSEPKRMSDDEAGKSTSELGVINDGGATINTGSGLARTKSCELLNPVQSQSSSSRGILLDNKPTEDDNVSSSLGLADDSTLTRETADLFSQAIDYSRFLKSQPTLDYKEYIERIIRSGLRATPTSDWFNALTSRIFFDVFSHSYWATWFKRKIQRKLYRIRLPHFMETLTLTQIDLGTNAPQFLNVVSHTFDASGLSIDFDMAYSGGLTMTFETKLNLLKIKSENASAAGADSASTSASGAQLGEDAQNQLVQESNNFDSNLPRDGGGSTCELSSENLNTRSADVGSKPSLSLSASSARTSCESTSDSDDSDSDSTSDSSFDEAELNEISDWEDYGAEKTRQNIVKFVDKIASSRYFQSATENRFIKKKLKDISNCPLVLVVQIQSLNGVLTLNVPPPQTDRLWYGFQPTPELTLKAIPRMGDREFNLSHVTDWIERKLAEEFRKILVMPNMEDIVLPVLKSDHMQYIRATR